MIEVQGWWSSHLVQREHFGRALSHFLFRDLQVSQANVGCWLSGLIPVALIAPMGLMEAANSQCVGGCRRTDEVEI
jgi:hypothetical protein